MGFNALSANLAGSGNTAIGWRALTDNTSGLVNTAIGHEALYNNISGGQNTAAGSQALYSNTYGGANTANGVRALYANSIGSNNAATGHSALASNTTGSYNTAAGAEALFSNTSGFRNSACGISALRGNTSGYKNTAIGDRALLTNVDGDFNIAIGQSAGASITGNHNVVVGNYGFAGESNTIRIGGTPHSRTFIAGIRGVTTDIANAIPVLVDGDGQLGTVSSSRRFKKDIADMCDATERLLELRPVVFHYKQEQTVPSGDVPLEYGLIAEEVAEIFPDLVVYDEEGKPFTVKYHLLSSMLLNELKKMDAAHVRELGELEELRSEVTRLRGLEERLAAVESRMSPAPRPATSTSDRR